MSREKAAVQVRENSGKAKRKRLKIREKAAVRLRKGSRYVTRKWLLPFKIRDAKMSLTFSHLFITITIYR